MRIWFDTEFLEDGHTIKLISIGMVREDGATLYAETPEAERLAGSSDWLRANVLPHLRGGSSRRHKCNIQSDIVGFAGSAPEFWAYYASYDWVALCQLFGTMMELPHSWPMFVRDVQQWRSELGNPDLPAQENEHDALADAQWTRLAWEVLRELREAA
ncbi:3'-5' exoribonuclease [Methylobacterium sp.]|uniref:3'-5' exoribonuclease domain-containing protein n=1 Tax=Methylobacterium sp. TaxID=409 RepID=UPI000C613629|nr:3'-5' exoribonuclease [Methylobacterium sp.]MBP33211.1 hypothetical protein [Methylobacterium sp.]